MRAVLRNIRQRLGPLWWYSLLMLAVSQTGNLFNFIVGAFLVPDILDAETLGAVLPLTRLAAFLSVPLAVGVGTAMKFLNVFQIRGEAGRVKTLLRHSLLFTLMASAAILGQVWWSRGFVHVRLRVEGNAVMLLVGALAVASCWQPVAEGAAVGLKRFSACIVSRVIGPATRLLLAWLLLRRFQVIGYLAAQLGGFLIVIGFLLWGFRRHVQKDVRAISYAAHVPDMLRYMLFLGLFMAAGALQAAVEPWVVRHRLPEPDSAGFYFATLFGSIPAYLAGAIFPFLFPLVSEAHEQQQRTRAMLFQAMVVVAGVGAAITVLLAAFGAALLDLRDSWRVYRAYSPYLAALAAATTLDGMIGCFVSHETACRRFRFLAYYAPILVAEAAGLYTMTGWTFFRGRVPDDVWAWVHAQPIRTLAFVVGVMVATRALLFLIMLLQAWLSREAWLRHPAHAERSAK